MKLNSHVDLRNRKCFIAGNMPDWVNTLRMCNYCRVQGKFCFICKCKQENKTLFAQETWLST